MGMSEAPKILIISHNLFDVTNNIGKTLVSLMEGYPKEKLGQIYFRNDYPSFHFCENYYCITDKEVLISLLCLGIKKAGNPVLQSESISKSSTEQYLYRVGNRRNPAVELVRDLMWSFRTWKSKTLANWLKEFDPDIILFAPNDYCLAYQIAIYVQKIVNKPIIPFYMDDSFYFNCKTGWIDNFRRKKLRTYAQNIHKYSLCLFTICDEMSEVYDQKFGLPCYAYVNAVSEVAENMKEGVDEQNELVVSYLGNLHSRRWESILAIADCFDDLNATAGYKIRFKIFSGSDIDSAVRRRFSERECIEFMGFIGADEVRAEQCASDILVHVEAFDKRSRYSTRLSLSTKIPEYLSTGVCVLAYGPEDIASMRYLKNYGVAQTCVSLSELPQKIIEVVDYAEYRRDLAAKGLELVRKKHMKRDVSRRFQDMLVRVADKDGGANEANIGCSE